jgi:hypothetical protein
MLLVLIESIVTDSVRYPKVLRRSARGSDLSHPLDENPDKGDRYDAQKVSVDWYNGCGDWHNECDKHVGGMRFRTEGGETNEKVYRF